MSERERPTPQVLLDAQDHVDEVHLNREQQETLSYLFDPNNPYREDDDPYPCTFGVDRGQLVVNGVYLHTDGEWATFHEEDGNMVIYVGPDPVYYE